MQMGRLRDSSIQLRIWENREYKDAQRLAAMMTMKRQGSHNSAYGL